MAYLLTNDFVNRQSTAIKNTNLEPHKISINNLLQPSRTVSMTTAMIRDGSISQFQFRDDIDTIFTKYRDIDKISIRKNKSYVSESDPLTQYIMNCFTCFFA